MSHPNPCLEDMKAARAAFEKDDFALMNIMGNRLMSNSIFLSEDQKRFLMAGFFVKELAIELLLTSGRGRTAAIAAAKAAATPYLTKVTSLIRSGAVFDFEGFWKVYADYAEDMRKFSMSEVEEHAYTENKAFTRAATEWLLKYLHEQKDLLFDSRNNLLEGILNEIGRVYLVHGGELRELQMFVILDYLQKVYNYVRHGFTRPDGKLEPEIVRSEIHLLVDRITSLLSTPSQTPAPEDVTDVLLTLLVKWRQYFIRYMELRPPRGVAPEKGIELPEETRKRITEAITKTLERETRK